MPKLDEKVQRIGSAIATQAEGERKAIIDKANRIREKELKDCEERLIDEMFEQAQRRSRDIRLKAVGDRAQVELGARREILTRREQLATAVFAAVCTRLREHSAAPEYRDELLSKAEALKERWDPATSVVQLRPDDMALADAVRERLPGCTVEAEPAIKLGGFRLLNAAAGILWDESIDARLEEQKSWFLMNCGLKVTD